MKKYKVWGQIGSCSFDHTIEANGFEWTRAGVYCFRNTETGAIWCYPVNRTVVELIVKE